MNDLQENYINACRTQEVRCSVYLVNGIKLTGSIVASDSESLLLKNEAQTQLLFKHAISTIMPTAHLDIDDIVSVK